MFFLLVQEQEFVRTEQSPAQSFKRRLHFLHHRSRGGCGRRRRRHGVLRRVAIRLGRKGGGLEANFSPGSRLGAGRRGRVVKQSHGEAQLVNRWVTLVNDLESFANLRFLVAGCLDAFGQSCSLLVDELVIQEVQALQRDIGGVAPLGGKRRQRVVKQDLEFVGKDAADGAVHSA